jgi:hypothetical protein
MRKDLPKAYTIAIIVMTFVILIPTSIIEANSYSNNLTTSNAAQNSDVLSNASTPVRTMWLDSKYLFKNSPVQSVAETKTFLKSIENPDYVYVRPARVFDGNPGVLGLMSLNFASLVHSASSKTKVLAIVDVVTDNSSGRKDPEFCVSDIYCDLSNASNRNILVETMSQFVNHNGFDGVYIDIEPLISGTTWLPQMIEQFKALTHGKTVIVYGFSLVDDDHVSGYGWSTSYLQSVSSVADYVELRLYNFNVNTTETYNAKILDQITRVESAGLTEKVTFILPVYPGSSIHDPSIENIENAGPLVQTFNIGLFAQAYMTENDYVEYLALIGK